MHWIRYILLILAIASAAAAALMVLSGDTQSISIDKDLMQTWSTLEAGEIIDAERLELLHPKSYESHYATPLHYFAGGLSGRIQLGYLRASILLTVNALMLVVIVMMIARKPALIEGIASDHATVMPADNPPESVTLRGARIGPDRRTVEDDTDQSSRRSA